MRTQTEILNEIKAAYIADTTVRERYNITGTATFDELFSPVSIEALIFYVVSVAIYGCEYLFAQHIIEVEAREDQMRIGGIPWWIKLCQDFQFGDTLVYNENTHLYEYAVIDESAQIIKYAAVREGSSGLNILVNTDSGGLPAKIEDSSAERDAFDAYLRKVKIAGLPLTWGSYNADQIKVQLTVVRDAMLLNSVGELIEDGSKPVDNALSAYIASLAFGTGVINKTALLNAIEAATGVIDVYFTTSGWLQVSTDAVPAFTAVSGQNLQSFGGSFILQESNLTINYIANV